MLSTLRRAAPVLATLLVALSAKTVHATGGPWDGPAFAADPAALFQAASALPGEPDGGIDMILLETVYSFDDAGRQTYTQRMVYRFTDGSAHESWSAMEQAWSPWHQDRPVLKARVIAREGGNGTGVVEHRLDPATITENAEAQSSPDMFEDGRVLRAPLPATGAGSVVEEEVTVRETAPFFDGGTVDFANLQMAVPVRHVRLVLDAPAGLPLRWVARQLPGVSPTEQVAGGRRRLTFAVDDLKEYEEPEAGLPPEVPLSAYVAFSTGQSWGDLARRYSDIVDRTIRGADLAGFLRSATPPGTQAGSQVETINALLRKLGREIRYTGVELAEGGLLPRTPGETLKRKFGDCKDKAVLLTALLRSLDIPAYVALLNAGEGESDVEEALPGMGAFNHAIVMVPGSPAVWIDPTDPFSRAGELPVGDQGRLALVASPTATGLVRTPEASSADNREVETREIHLSDLGGARVVETTEYWGAEENDLRSSYAGASEEDLRDTLAGYMSETYLADSLTGFEYTEPDDLSQPFRLRLEASEAARGTTDVRDAVVAVFLSTFTDRLPGEITGYTDDEEEDTPDAGPRRHDYVFTRPFQVEVRYRIVPPAGFTPRPLPAYRSRQFGPARLEEAYAVEADGVVTATLRFDTGKRRISPAEFEALRIGVRQIAEEKPVLIAFDQTGESLLAAGRVREALDEFRRLAALAPGKALPRTRIARALLAGGLGEAAREEAEAAVKVEPGFAWAWVTLGWIRQHDDLGRRFGRGYDRAGAIAAYRKAKELDPEDTEARADLAILLEHDARGERYGPGADLAAAIEEYAGIEDGLEDLGLANNLVIATMWAQRFDEMKERLEAMDGADGRAALKLVALAAIESTDAALRSAERTFSDANARAEALSGAGRNLMLLRRYPEAAALFEAAGRQSSNAAALLGMAELLRKTRRYEELAFAPKDPASTVKRLSTLAAGSLSGAGEMQQFSSLVSREMTGEFDEEARKSFWEGFESGFNEARRAARAANLPLSVALDLGLAVLRPTVSGDDAVGYRVVMTSSVADRIRNVAYVIPEDGEYRIAATDKAIATVGKEALRRLDRNDLKGARQWLDWAYDEELARKGPEATDPGMASPFLDLWRRGAEADAGQARCAAASLMAWDNMPVTILSTLTACRQAEAEGARQAVLDRALLSAYRGLGQDSEAAETAGRLQESSPDSAYLYGARVAALLRLGRRDDARRAAEARLARLPDDLAAQQTLVDLALRQGDFDTAESILQRAADAGRADAGIYNQIAWLRLFRGNVDERTVELAQRAATLSGYKSYDVLHTLAALYAEQGKTGEAYRLILQALEAKGGEPGDPDWYVFGRLAESYGLPDAARRCYEKAKPEGPGETSPVSSLHLVRRRLEALDAKPEPKRVASRPARP